MEITAFEFLPQGFLGQLKFPSLCQLMGFHWSWLKEEWVSSDVQHGPRRPWTCLLPLQASIVHQRGFSDLESLLLLEMLEPAFGSVFLSQVLAVPKWDSSAGDGPKSSELVYQAIKIPNADGCPRMSGTTWVLGSWP